MLVIQRKVKKFEDKHFLMVKKKITRTGMKVSQANTELQSVFIY